MPNIKLNIGNSYSNIIGLSAKQEKDLRKSLSYTIGGSAAFFSGYGVRKKSLLDKKGYFPTGLLHRLSINADTIIDNRIKPSIRPANSIKGINPYQWQHDQLKCAILNNRGIITAPTGTGKSLAMAMVIAKLNVKTLVIVPSLEIKKQLAKSLENLGLINAHVENIDNTNLFNDLFYKIQFDCLIIDEGHHVAAKTYRKLNKTMWNNIYYRFYYTATPFRNDAEEILLFESIVGQIIYKLSYKEAVAKKYIVPIEAYYIELEKKENNLYTWPEVYKELVINNDTRNAIITNLILNLVSEDKSVLCLVKEVKHGKKLSNTYFVHGEDEETRYLIKDFNSSKIKGLVATQGIMGEGIDTKPCEYVIIAGLGKAKSQFMQAIGRCLRVYPGKISGKIILFQDKSHKFTSRHFKEECRILRDEYDTTPIKLDL